MLPVLVVSYLPTAWCSVSVIHMLRGKGAA